MHRRTHCWQIHESRLRRQTWSRTILRPTRCSDKFEQDLWDFTAWELVDWYFEGEDQTSNHGLSQVDGK